MEGLMMMQPDFEKKKNCRIRDDLLNGNESAGVYTYLITGFLNWSKRLFRLKGDFLGDQLKRSLRSAWQS
jgi:hypothetical protein